MNSLEKRTAFSVVAIFVLRMLGLFMLMPVIPVLAGSLQGATPFLVGLSVGIYGLTQAGLQMPFGWLSDKIGRKPIIIGGLLVFAIGSLLAAEAESIYGVIFGRALQGAGAIAAALLALVTDAAQEKNRTKLMAIIGVSIGFSILLSFVVGPWLASLFGLSGLFVIAAIFAVIAIVITLFGVPGIDLPTAAPIQFRHAFSRLVQHKLLVKLDISILCLHFLMTALFVVLPQWLKGQLAQSLADSSLFYASFVLLSFVLMVPCLVWASKRQKVSSLVTYCVLALAASFLIMSFSGSSVVLLGVGFTLFFTAFNVMEASLPSMVGKTAPAGLRGAAMGLFSTAQFLGAFLGGAVAGILMQYTGPQLAFWVFALVCLFWWLGISSNSGVDQASTV